MHYDVGIIGAGIVGLSTARAVLRDDATRKRGPTLPPGAPGYLDQRNRAPPLEQ